MRRIIVLLSLIVIVVLMAASAALAATVNCPSSGGCYGTSSSDTIYGTSGHNDIYAYGGNDIAFGSGGDDYVAGYSGNDLLYGHGGADILWDWSGNDKFSGWSGKDQMFDTSSSTSDTYRHFFVGASEDRDVVRDHGGGGDLLDLTNVNKSQVFIAGVDTTQDADTNKDSLLIEKKGTTNSVLVRNYFNNAGGSNPGTGAIETIKFNDATVGFLAI